VLPTSSGFASEIGAVGSTDGRTTDHLDCTRGAKPAAPGFRPRNLRFHGGFAQTIEQLRRFGARRRTAHRVLVGTLRVRACKGR
jgi:hypothetical protein